MSGRPGREIRERWSRTSACSCGLSGSLLRFAQQMPAPAPAARGRVEPLPAELPHQSLGILPFGKAEHVMPLVILEDRVAARRER